MERGAVVRVIVARNVNHAYRQGMDLLDREGVIRSSRNGQVTELAEPVTTCYINPTERVLFDDTRDANPFFHMYESIWMLAGRNDIQPLVHYASNMASYSDDGRTQHGAYGFRWREFFGIDQLVDIIARLKREPDDRRCVLQMWAATADLGGRSKDHPCNTQIYFKIGANRLLNMTVCCRSNDIIWGAYGANAVHMSFLHEYMAAMIGVPIGIYRQVSDSFHAYQEIFEKLRPTAGNSLDLYPRIARDQGVLPQLVDSPERFDRECLQASHYDYGSLANRWFVNVFAPMMEAWEAYKAEDLNGALHIVERVGSTDWRIAAKRWLARRAAKRGINAD